ncbi:bifunctional phosphopantothenoylcysteine decarboxylase/phosphopantothenate--cysteine ligase CoaBC [Desulfovibrio sp. OttesenSCG-928-F07]|nr:bifunctional phosphopantothenoylcysteine decarboxylase/phosphopantothenate--cysteine ligase CoaBC [Desulfovibrio sp. OttesenSCG-928-F07]
MEAYFPKAPFAGKLVQLGISGSVAAYKAADLLRAFYKNGMRVNVTLTGSAQKFISPLTFRALGAENVYTAMFAHEAENAEHDPFGHLAPGAEADAFVIAPASATTLARLACGTASEILSAQALAWPRQLVLAPAMNPRMWQNKATQENCQTLIRRGAVMVQPDSGLVACGEVGDGRFADLRTIYLHTLKAMSVQDLAGKKVMLTLGPTREAWDGVRFWSNYSTGIMGAALAVAAWLRGAEVHAVCGPTAVWLPSEIKRYNVTAARQMYDEALKLWPDMHIGIFTAAVADFAPAPFGDSKFKKDKADGALNISFTANPDILASIGAKKHAGQRIIGFAAETDNVKENARKKLKAKNADLLVANQIGVSDSGFAGVNNTAFVVDTTGREQDLPNMLKADLAWRVIDCLLTL